MACELAFHYLVCLATVRYKYYTSDNLGHGVMLPGLLLLSFYLALPYVPYLQYIWVLVAATLSPIWSLKAKIIT
jgi:hypothetical protein